MNRFRTRRRAKEQQQLPSHSDLDSALGFSFASKSLGKNKKPTPDSKPVIDLSTALPPSNDFRTSLLMPNLSARFSMLREQDDPSTKVGKANDDSVLFPKRASRLNLFSHNPLTDIAEVSSIRESIRPPFAYGERTNSVDSDDYDSDGGASMMSRSRHGEGNTLFGGRQKLYKISTESSFKSPLSLDASHPDSGAMSGRVMYEDDVSLSLFQRHREKEREERRKQLRRDSLDAAEDDSQHSPSTNFSKDRGTTSSTTSGPRRSSTAATSIDSQSHGLMHNNGSASGLSSPKMTLQPKPGVDLNATVYRKLYGQALNQSNSPHRVAQDAFENTVRPRAVVNDMKANLVSPFKVNSSPSDSSYRPEMSTASILRSPSPPLSGSPARMQMLESALRDVRPLEGGQGQGYGYARPLSPPVSDGEDAATFVNSVQPEDRGKATAMGLFNKPSRRYDEQQFSQRQVQMYQGRNSPGPRKGWPTPASTPALSDQDTSVLNKDNPREETTPVGGNARARAASFIRQQNEEVAALEATRTASSQESNSTLPSSRDAGNRNTFLDDDDESSSKHATISSVSGSETSHETHPALRPIGEGFRSTPFDNTAPIITQPDDDLRPISVTDNDDSDTLGNDRFDPHSGGLGLSGLIRTHLRNDSDRSSIYPPVSPLFPSAAGSESPKPRDPPLSPHALDERAQPQATDMQLRMAQNAKRFLNNATFLKNRPNSQTNSLADADDRVDPSIQGPEGPPSWQDELQSRHHRGGSTETQQEREAFNNELAERRRKVQEKLKNVVDTNSRSASPVPPAESSLGKPGIGFSAMLRTKPSRSRVSNDKSAAPEHSSKAMKLLGMGGSGAPNYDFAKRPQEELGKDEELRMLEDFGHRSKPKHTFGPSPGKNFPQARPEPSSSKTSQNTDGDRSRQRSVTPASTRSSARDRSTSDVSSRSKSRNGPYRDDLEKAMAEGTGIHARTYGLPNTSTTSLATRPANEAADQPERSASAMSGRYRSNSKANTPGYFDSKTLNPLQTSGMPSSSSSISTRPSPRGLYSANSTPIFETSPVNPNPSSATLPLLPDGRITPSLRGRKRSVTKNMISDPTFISTTYSVSTVDLPAGASLRNGSPGTYARDPSTPAIPFMNPSRRRGRIGTGASTTHTILPTLAGRSNDSKADLLNPHSAGLSGPHSAGLSGPHSAGLSGPHSAGPSMPADRSTFSDETSAAAEEKKPSPLRVRQKLRKVSSEGGDMSVKARYQALMAGPSPALPTFPVKSGPSPTTQRMEGGMF